MNAWDVYCLKTIFYKVDLKISNNPKICRFLPTFFQLMLLLLKTCHSIFRPKSYYLIIKSFLQNILNFKISRIQVNQNPISHAFLIWKSKNGYQNFQFLYFQVKIYISFVAGDIFKKMKIGSWKWGTLYITTFQRKAF